MFICEGIRGREDASHTMVDPMQFEWYHGVGVAQLERSGVDYFDLIESPSELALPELLRSSPEGFDFVFIDGWHTFDHTVLDLFYASRLLRVGGYVVVDDCNMKSVAAAVAYYANYPAFEQVRQPALEPRTPNQRRVQLASRVVPDRLARWILPAELYDVFYRRMRFPSMVALKKVGPDDRRSTWFKGF
jgi:hypothetical protein